MPGWDGGLARSERMQYVQIQMPADAAENFVDIVAREGIVEFTDLNKHLQPTQRKYMSDIVALQQLERKVHDIQTSIEDYSEQFHINEDFELEKSDMVAHREEGEAPIRDILKKDINEAYKTLNQQIQAEKQLLRELLASKDTQSVLSQVRGFDSAGRAARAMLGQDDEKAEPSFQNADPSVEMAQRGLLQGGGVGFRYLAGVVTVGQRQAFHKQVFLASRGNVYILFEDIPDTPDRETFVVYFLGDRLKRSIKRLCAVSNIQIFVDSDDNINVQQKKSETERKITELKHVHEQTLKALGRLTRDTARKVKNWKVQVMQERSIRETLNKFEERPNGNLVQAEGWVPADSVQRVQDALDQATENLGVPPPPVNEVPPRSMPPTYFKTNKFTSVFQGIVDTYGVPRYQELNPALYTIITFPFLTAVMYGDVFHGAFQALFGFTMIWFEPKLNAMRLGEIPKMLYGGRYVIFMIGLFACFNGFVYNDVASISMSLANSTWDLENTAALNLPVMRNDNWVQPAQLPEGCDRFEQEGYDFVSTTAYCGGEAYAFGVDPAWHATENQLEFLNSFKMKLSVILGVLQMTFGLFLKLTNKLSERDYISVFFESLPEITFMFVFFVYMCFLICYKWSVDYINDPVYRDIAPPDIKTILIKMVLGFGKADNDEMTQMFPDAEFQTSMQQIFVILMLLAVPLMLIPKPILLYLKNKREQGGGAYQNMEHPEEEQALNGGGKEDDSHSAVAAHGHGPFEMGEVCIHQMIHTIEYVLGTISNTASYLRLWALSLAHAELADVFFSMGIAATLNMGNPIAVFIGVIVFFVSTTGVLLMMDLLECFLHALRLHWVEFQNKFYYGDGIAFEPFAYKGLLDVKD